MRLIIVCMGSMSLAVVMSFSDKKGLWKEKATYLHYLFSDKKNLWEKNGTPLVALAHMLKIAGIRGSGPSSFSVLVLVVFSATGATVGAATGVAIGIGGATIATTVGVLRFAVVVSAAFSVPPPASDPLLLCSVEGGLGLHARSLSRRKDLCLKKIQRCHIF